MPTALAPRSAFGQERVAHVGRLAQVTAKRLACRRHKNTGLKTSLKSSQNTLITLTGQLNLTNIKLINLRTCKGRSTHISCSKFRSENSNQAKMQDGLKTKNLVKLYCSICCKLLNISTYLLDFIFCVFRPPCILLYL